MDKFPLLDKEQIEVKVKKVTENGAVLLLYKTARVDMDLLDEVAGVENWVCDYKDIKGNLYCGIGIRESDEKPFIWKWDCGIESREDGEGNEKKGEASDSFKRAGFKWGIGRELYTAPFIFVDAGKCYVRERSGRYYCGDKFAVEKIVYDTVKRRITALAIRNVTAKVRCFVWQENANAI